MAKYIATILLLITLLLGGTGFKVVASVTKDKATWLWDPWMIINDENQIIQFLERKQINKVYIQIDQDLPMKFYRGFIDKASATGMRIYALDGAADWVSPKGYVSQNQLMNWLNSYQKTAKSSQKFMGVHLDVEPYLYSGWTKNQGETIRSYQSLLSSAKKKSLQLKLVLEVDMPFWFDEIPYKNSYGKGVLAEWVITQTDSVTIMAYRNSAPMIIDIVKKELELSRKYNKPLVIGVETGRTDEGDYISFNEKGESFMNKQLKAVQAYYGGTASFNGIALHHVGSWMSMKP